MYEKVLLGMVIVLALCALAALYYIVTAMRFTDRIVGVNLVSTLVLNIIAILSIYLEVTFIIDVAMVYAFLGFLAIVVLCRLLALQTVEKGLDKDKEYRRKEDMWS